MMAPSSPRHNHRLGETTCPERHSNDRYASKRSRPPWLAQHAYTNLAVLDISAEDFVVSDMAPGLTFEAPQAVTDAPLHMAN
jgi:acyl CoA:acetate/3-ketoacid CoA transferase beta subunit